MLGPGTDVAVPAVCGIDEEVSLAIRTGYVGEGPFESGAVHTQVGGSNVGDGTGKGIGLEYHGLGGFSIPVGSHQADRMLGARVGGCSACISGDGSGVGIDV